MNDTLQVTIWGTSEYIAPVLQAFGHDNRFEIKLFVSKPHALSTLSPLLPVHATVITPESLKEDKEEIISTIKSENIALGIVADYGKIIPQAILDAPRHGFINIHFSRLPYLRGASPVQYTILQGLPKATYSIIEMSPEDEPKVDSGKIIYQESMQLNQTETTDYLYTQLFQKAGEEITDVVWEYVEGNIIPFSQDHSQATYTTPSGKFDRTTLIQKDDAFITPDMKPLDIQRRVRAFSPWPKAWTTLENLYAIMHTFDSSISTIQPLKDPQTRVILHEATLADDQLQIHKLQAEGKKAMSWQEFKNGWFE